MGLEPKWHPPHLHFCPAQKLSVFVSLKIWVLGSGSWVPCDGCLGPICKTNLPQKVGSMTCCLKADAFSIPFSNCRDVRNDKWLHVDSSGYDGASAKNDEISGRKTFFFVLEPGLCFETPFFFTGPTILQVPGSLGI